MEADAALDLAARLHAVWTTATDALMAARALFTVGDYGRAEHAADVAVEQAKLGIAQTRYPMLPMPQP